jgi:DNA-binding NarL/FixJ family response regulator
MLASPAMTWHADIKDRGPEVFPHLAEGMSDRAIATRLFVAPETLARHT